MRKEFLYIESEWKLTNNLDYVIHQYYYENGRVLIYDDKGDFVSYCDDDIIKVIDNIIGKKSSLIGNVGDICGIRSRVLRERKINTIIDE